MKRFSDVFQKIQVRTILGDAKLNIAMFQACPNGLSLSRYSTENRDACVKLCARTLLRFALPPGCRDLGLTLRTDRCHSILRLASQGEYVVRCPLVRMVWPGHFPKGKISPQSPSFVSLGLLVTFVCRSGLNSRGGVSRVHATDATPTHNCTDKNKYREARARTYKYKNKYNTANTNTTTNTKTGRTIQKNNTKCNSTYEYHV